MNKNLVYNDFFINGTQITEWGYDEHKNELSFYAGSLLVASISYSKEEFDILNEMAEIEQWNNLTELFGD